MKRTPQRARPALPGAGVSIALVQVALVTLLWAAPARPTTYVTMLDAALFDQAEVVVEGTVLQRRPGFARFGPVTDHFVTVDREIKGDTRWRTIVVRTPGGSGAGGTELVIPGSPALANGARVLLFLVRNRDDTFSPLHLGLGSFFRRGAGPDALAIRTLGDAVLLDTNLEPTVDTVRGYDRFVAWLNDRARGRREAPDYHLARDDSLGNAVAPFNLMESDDKNVRWFAFDDNESVDWRFRSMDSEGTQSEFEAALAAWSLEPVRLTLAGSTDRTAGFQSSDGENSIIFGDPNGEVAGTYSCEDGGTLASGGWWQRSETGTFEGETYVRLVEADIVVNDGTECLFRESRAAGAEMLTHELGHTLGIAHSCGEEFDQPCRGGIRDGATMRGALHDDGRGAEIRLDDAAALSALYGSPPPPAVESAPDQVTVVAKKAAVARLRWVDNSADEDAFEIWGRSGGPRFERFAETAADAVTVKLKGLEPGARYEFKVRARVDGLLTLFSDLAPVSMPESKLARPRRLRAQAFGPTSGRLTWKDKSSGEKRFLIERRIGSGEWSSWRTAPANATSLEFSDARSGETYGFRVRAKAKGEKSDFSNTATLTLP